VKQDLGVREEPDHPKGTWPEDEAAQMLTYTTGCAPGMVPDGELTIPVRVCESCVKRGHPRMHVGLVSGGLPVYQPRRRAP
jgi:hypothetical protein